MSWLCPRQCTTTYPTPAAATRRGMSASARPPLTSLTSCAPASSANSATRARIVSMETVSPARTSSVTTGPIRRSSSASSMRWAPGRADPPPPPGADLARGPAQLQRRPDQERLRLERGQRGPGRVLGAGEDEEARLPDRAELGVELVQRLDLEPLGHEDEHRPPGPQHRAGT